MNETLIANDVKLFKMIVMSPEQPEQGPRGPKWSGNCIVDVNIL